MSNTSLIVDPAGNKLERKPSQTQDLQAFIMEAVLNPDFSVEKLERMIALQERQEASRRKDLFDAALIRVQAQIPRITKNGMIDYSKAGEPPKKKIPYALLEDIDAVIRPIYQAEGFSVRWNNPITAEGKMVRTVGTFTCCGHSETVEITTPPDQSGGKNACQATPSAISYGKRIVSTMFWNIITEGQDLDGARGKEQIVITQEQADDITTLLNDLDPKLLPKFCRVMGVEQIGHMKASQLDEAHKRIKAEAAKRAPKA